MVMKVVRKEPPPDWEWPGIVYWWTILMATISAYADLLTVLRG
jgi:hypothetical protein